MDQIRIMIADDHELIHSGISDILKLKKEYVIVGHAFNGTQAIVKAVELKPQLIFMDISMPEMNGIESTREIKDIMPDVKVIALTQHEDKEYLLQVLKAGGDGYLLKNSKREDFYNAIEAVMNNRRFISNDLSVQMINSVLESDQKEKEGEKIHLTRREIEIIKKVAEARSNQEIADELHISLRTVETHRRNLMQKLKVNSVVALLKVAAANNLIDI